MRQAKNNIEKMSSYMQKLSFLTNRKKYLDFVHEFNSLGHAQIKIKKQLKKTFTKLCFSILREITKVAKNIC